MHELTLLNKGTMADALSYQILLLRETLRCSSDIDNYIESSFESTPPRKVRSLNDI